MSRRGYAGKYTAEQEGQQKQREQHITQSDYDEKVDREIENQKEGTPYLKVSEGYSFRTIDGNLYIIKK